MTTRVLGLGWLAVFLVACGGGTPGGDAGPADGATLDAPATDAPATDAPGSDAPMTDGGPTGTLIAAATGGTVTSPDGVFTLTIPPGAIAADTTFSVRVVPAAELPADVLASHPLSAVYEVLPSGVTFSPSATGTWTYPTGLAGTTSGGSYGLLAAALKSDASPIDPSPTTSSTYDGAELVTTADVPHLSLLWLASQPDVQAQLRAPTTITATNHAVTATLPTGDRAVGSTFVASPATVDLGNQVEPLDSVRIEWLADMAGQARAEMAAGAASFTSGGDVGWSADVSGFFLAGTYDITPAPTWTCVSAGAGRLALRLEGSWTIDHPHSPSTTTWTTVGTVRSTVHCVTPTIGTYATIASPEHVQPFCLNDASACGPGLRTYTASGLMPGAYAVVAGGSATTGGVDVVRLSDGFRSTHPFPPLSGYRGATMAKRSAGLSIVAYGTGGLDEVSWAGAYGGDGLTPYSNATDHEEYDFDADGVDEYALTVFSGAVRTSAGTLSGTSSFPGSTSPQALSAAMLPDGVNLVTNLASGEVYSGPAAGPLTLGGVCGTNARLMRCTPVGTRLVCVIADYGGNQVCVVEVDALGATVYATAPAPSAPVDPAIMAMPGATSVRIAAAGSTDPRVRVYTYDLATHGLVADPDIPVPSAATINHVAFVTLASIVASDFGTGNLYTIPIP